MAKISRQVMRREIRREGGQAKQEQGCEFFYSENLKLSGPEKRKGPAEGISPP
jgi:hypothetical protein